MALVKFVRCAKSQTSGGLWGTLRYCCRENKTAYEGRQLVTGVNCVAETAFREFLNTKRLYEKTEGRQFYQLIQSFHPEENLTPQTAHEIALQLAEEFAGFEVVVATHTDREHIHSHFIINSVSADTGKKYHSNIGVPPASAGCVRCTVPGVRSVRDPAEAEKVLRDVRQRVSRCRQGPELEAAARHCHRRCHGGGEIPRSFQTADGGRGLRSPVER